jgi:8-oxo-dGTP diphosphatase
MESHMTATGLVLNKQKDKALMIFHKKLQLWLPAGGHIEQGELPHEAAIREVFEETGVKASVVDASQPLDLTTNCREIQLPCPRWILHEYIPAHNEKSAHMHYDFMYLMVADHEDCCHAEREVSAARWVSRDELANLDTTEAVRAMYCLILR